MKLSVLGLLTLGLLALASASARSEDATAVIDKAIKAHGGEESLGKVKAYSTTAKQNVYFGGNENSGEQKQTTKGPDHIQQKFESDFNGAKFEGYFVLAGDKGWSKFGENGGPMDEGMLGMIKRSAYIDWVAVTILPLKSKEFKTTLAGEEKVGDKPAAAVKATGPDGKEFTAYFDKESGLLLKITTPNVIGFGGDEATQEILYSEYKEMGGIKKAMKTQMLRNGEKLIETEIADFKVLDKVDDATFAEPK